ncbi:cysteine methyltransferase [Aeromicrobium sp. Root495]|uniref:MGMT family protein n=1 Tax=Aeromicrobium sp. Root495 TaxID=1736550 RepID=UPI0006F69B3C|nr:MGMT family protein [Aeromicrobium sp. Root495]KQY59904.1 cysteine methyltransferase [Aeromicrobium sp. Root495]
MSDFGERVLDVVETVPRGRVVTYGLIADLLGEGGPRQVGRVMATDGPAVTWWRVVRANGTLPPHLMTDAQLHWREERTPVVRGHVDLRRALWNPRDP